jgi:hypothetical protein
LPLRHSLDGQPLTVGCVRTNCTISGGPYHNYWAIDIADHGQQPGAPIFAAGRGQVALVDASHSACGPIGTPANIVIVDHGDGIATQYVHLATIAVSRGDWVDQNTQLGTLGAVGYTFPCPWYHLHFAVLTRNVATEIPPLKACHGSSLVTYPAEFGFGAWDSVPPYRFGVWSDGTNCAALPGRPSAVTATAGDGRASVGFSAPSSGLPITSYRVTSTPDGVVASGTASPIVVEGLTNGTSYTFTVTAVNTAGSGAASDPSNPVVPAGLPGAPDNVVATPGNRQALVSFDAPDDNGSPIASYTVTASPGGQSVSGSSTPVRVRSLANGTKYRFTVTATNGVGTGATSAPSNAVTPTATIVSVVRMTGSVSIDGEQLTSTTIPYGSVIDVSRGSLTIATDVGSATAKAHGTASAFELVRAEERYGRASRPVVRLRLAGGDFTRCASAKKSGTTIRGLSVVTRGRFETRGRYATAIARSATASWVVGDRCGGTLTAVGKGAIGVRHGSVETLVRAPHAYVAKPR